MKQRSAICLLIVTFLVIACFFFSSKVYASFCENSNWLVFRNFDEIVIYFPQTFNPSVEEALHYPDELKHKNLEKRLSGAIKSNFAPCLKSDDTSEKPVSVISYSMSNSREEKEAMFKIASQKLHDHRTLVIAVSYSYVNLEANAAGTGSYGQIMFDMYRPTMQSSRLSSGTSGMGVFFPQSTTQSLATQLDNFFKKIPGIHEVYFPFR